MKYLYETRVKNKPEGAAVYSSQHTSPGDLRVLSDEYDVLVIPADGSCEFDAGFFAAKGKKRIRTDDAADLHAVYASFGPDVPGGESWSYGEFDSQPNPEAFLKALLSTQPKVKGVVFGPVWREKDVISLLWRGRLVGALKALGVPVFVVDSRNPGYHPSVKCVKTVEELP